MRSLFTALLAMLLAQAALAQGSYTIQLDTEANLRASWSLDSELVTRAPQGTQLTVLKHFNRWLKVEYEGSVLWLADWIMHTRVDAAPGPVVAPTAPPEETAPTNYFIRLLTETNLRELHSLDSEIVAVLAEGGVLNVVDSFNRWLKVEYEGGHAWMAEWVQHETLTDAETTELFTSPPPEVYVDNCCQLGRECVTDAHWIGGLLDFMAGLCPAPADGDVIYITPEIAPLMNNCCLMGRSCDSEEDWSRGYYDYSRNMCAGAGMMMMSG